MTDRPWFDEQSGLVLIDSYVPDRPSYQHVLAEGGAADEELHAQAHLVVERLKALEASLTPEQHHLATEALCELSVLHALHALHTQRFGATV